MDNLDKMLADALKSVLPQGEMVTKAQILEMFDGLKLELTNSMNAAVTEMVQKAMPVDRDGAGRKTLVLTPEEQAREAFENDPVAFLVRKGEPETPEEKAVALALFKKEFENLR